MRRLDDPKLSLVIGLAFLAVVGGGVVDLALDAPESWLTAHVLVEVVLISLSLGLGLYLLRGWAQTSASLSETRERLGERREERDAWRQRARRLLEGLGREIDRQFEEWDLTPSEREVALLLIKGHSHKRIARMTDRSERTSRQHATSVYRKAGLSGRAALAGFFLEDLILPRDGSPSNGSSEGGSGAEIEEVGQARDRERPRRA